MTVALVASFEAWLGRADEYFLDHRLRLPAKAFSGRGHHLLFAYPPILAREYADLRQRLRAFGEQFVTEFSADLARLGCKLDLSTTYSLKQLLRVCGTARPGVGVVSRFYGGDRVEDEHLREYLLGLEVSVARSAEGVKKGVASGFTMSGALPGWFEDLLRRDRELWDLWRGVGKPAHSDTSRSGFDYSVVRRLLWLGRTDVTELATILSLRPHGAAREKGEPYIRRTLSNAVLGERIGGSVPNR